jgi:hypothetical protein
MNWILLPIVIFMAVLHFIEYLIFHYLSLHHFKHKTYAQLIALDRYANGLLGGDSRETVSSRLGKKKSQCRFCNLVCKVLDWFDEGHCDKSIGT